MRAHAAGARRTASRSRVSDGRVAAVQALLQVEQGEHAERALGHFAPPSSLDRALAWRLVRGVCQHRRELDHIVAHAARRPVERLDPVPRNVLRLAVYELRWSRVPPHAAVHEAVNLTRTAGTPQAASFVNAVLRHQATVPPPSPRDELNHPEWLLARWEQRHGTEPATAWARSNNLPAPLGFVSRDDPEAVAKDLRAAGLDPAPARIGEAEVPGVWSVEGTTGHIEEIGGFREGRWWIQDPAAVAVSDLVLNGFGPYVLDACAAPGGKSFRLASRGFRVTSLDRTAERVALIEENARRLGLMVRAAVHDWTTGGVEGTFDTVLVDAPCSSLGVIRRHPEVRWHRKPHDLPVLAARQLQILEAAAPNTREGGCLVYAVCSGEPEEGEGVISAFLSRHADFSLDEVLYTAPPSNQEDTFFAARLLRHPRAAS